MKTLEESVVISMDGSNTALFPFLPYILQDLWQMGTNPAIIIDLIKKHSSNYSSLRLLDLGCGKGAVSIQIAKELNCSCLGVDALEAFIKEAKDKAIQYEVSSLCEFKTADIRHEIKNLKNFDVILLGSIGSVFGDYYSTLTTIKPSLNQDGIIIIDDGYIADNSNFTHPLIEKKLTILKHVDNAGMQLVDENILSRTHVMELDDNLFPSIQRRCLELINKYPEKQQLFTEYIRKQKQEARVLENKITCATILLRVK